MENPKQLEIGERVMRKGLTATDTPRFGVLVDVYRGHPSAMSQGVLMCAVRWDDTGLTEHGYFPESLHRYLAVPTMVVPNQ